MGNTTAYFSLPPPPPHPHRPQSGPGISGDIPHPLQPHQVEVFERRRVEGVWSTLNNVSIRKGKETGVNIAALRIIGLRGKKGE